MLGYYERSRIWVSALVALVYCIALPAYTTAEVRNLGALTERSLQLSLDHVETEGETGQLVLTVAAPTGAIPAVQVVSNPIRLILDISSATIKVSRNQRLPLTGHPWASGLRVANTSVGLRVVIDWQATELPAWDIEQATDRLVVRVRPSAPVSPTQESTAGSKTPLPAVTLEPLMPTPTPPVEPTPTTDPIQTQIPFPSPSPTSDVVSSAQATPHAPRLLAARREALQKASDSDRDIVLPSGLPPLEQLLKFSVDKMHILFSGSDRPIQNVVLKNKTAYTMYITAKAEKLTRPGFQDQSKVPTNALLVSPRRLTLDPQGQRTVRLVLQTPANVQEDVYRIVFVPQTDSFDKTLVEAQISGEPARVAVVAGLAVSVSSVPLHAEPKIEWSRTKSGLVVLINRGTASVLLDSGKFCSDDGRPCVHIPSKRLYPGNTWGLRVPRVGTLEFLQRYASEYEPLIIPVEGS